jgi:endonuclease YncB( thermonuclease family)
VRLIDINAPESVKPGSPVECFGPRQFLHAMLVQRGAAAPRLYRPQHEYADRLAALGDQARAQNKGVYGKCGGG